MKNGAAPGWDGLPNDFFKILAGCDEKDEDSSETKPSKLAHLLSASYREACSGNHFNRHAHWSYLPAV